MSDTNEIQHALVSCLDEQIPVDLRDEEQCRLARVEQAARLAVRECRTLGLDQATAIQILFRLWRES